MPQAQFNESNTVLNYINTIVTLLGVILGVWTAFWHLNLKHATKHLGSICQDEELMGWFVAQVPGWWTRIFPFYIPRVPVPRVPYIFTLLEAGEAGVFTSSLFDSIRDGTRQVSWIPIYETFFVEAAWHSMEEWYIQTSEERETKDPLEQYGDVGMFLRNFSNFCSWLLIRLPWKLVCSLLGIPQKPSAASELPVLSVQNAAVQRRASMVVWEELRFAAGKSIGWVEYLHQYFGLFSTNYPKYILVARSRMPGLDRHLLYYHWDVRDDTNKDGSGIFAWLKKNRVKTPDDIPESNIKTGKRPPILVKAHHELLEPGHLDEQAPMSSRPIKESKCKSIARDFEDEITNATGDKEKVSLPEKYRQEGVWKWNFPSLWIHDDKPCIEVSEDELGALAIVLGIPLRCSEKGSLPSGPSAFSPCLTSTNDGCLTRLKIAYGRFRSSSPNSGSGYSILFAKYMACNCLPFAHELIPSVALKEFKYKLEVFHAVHVTAKVLSLIKQGNIIWTGSRGAGFFSASSKYLLRLPSFAFPYLYDSGILEEEDKFNEEKKEPGSIYKTVRAAQKHKLVGKWANAVAGIALGGLVPMAAEPLIEAVKFTVGGGIDIKDLDILEYLVDVVQRLTNKEIGGSDSGIQLFGFMHLVYNDLTAKQDKMDLGTSLKNQDRIIDIVMVLVRYNTLLERLLAMLLQTEKDPLNKVFSVLCKRISASYAKACAEEKERVEREEKEKENEEKESQEKQNHEKKKQDKDKTDENKLNKEIPSTEKGKDNGTEMGKGDHAAKPTKEETKPSPKNNPLKDLREKIKNSHEKWQPATEDVATVAEYTIKAWTCITKIVDWSEPGDEVDKSLKEEDKEHMYKPVPFANLPDVSLWE